MVSVPIGGVRVDLQLNSAAFIRDIAKSSAATARATTAMGKSLGGLQSSVATINKTMIAFLGVREIKKVINFTEQCLKLASTIKGPLGASAKSFINSATQMSNSFKLGVAQGFLEAVSAGLQQSEVSLQQLASAGIIVGNILGRILTTIVNFFTHDIPEGIKTSIESLNTLANAYNALAAARDAAAAQPSALAPGAGTGLLGGGETGSRLPIIETSTIQTQIKTWTDFANTQGVVAGALQTTDTAQKAVATSAGLVAEKVRFAKDMFEGTRTPLEAYRLEIEKINASLASMEVKSRAVANAQQALVQKYTDAASQVSSTLAEAFAENKAVQIANCLVNAAAAMVRALTLPFPLNWAQVAAVGALAVTQIAAIRSTSPKSGGNVKTGGGGGKSNSGVRGAGAASTAAKSASGGGDAGFTQAVTIEIKGDVFGPEHFRKMVAGINDVQRDGTALLRFA